MKIKNLDSCVWKIYKITNKINGKVYIGQTMRSLSKRLSEHLCYGVNRLSIALSEAGLNNFTIEQIDIAYSQDEANKKENFYIEQYESYLSVKGYNTHFSNGFGKRVVCLETGEIYLSAINVAKKYNKHKNAVYHHLRGIMPTLNGLHFAYLTEDGQIIKPKKRPKKGRFCRAVKCIETGDIFSSIKQAQKAYGISNLQSVLSGRGKTAAGYHWEYITERIKNECL